MLPYIEIGNAIFKIIIPSYALFGSIGLFCMMLLIYSRSQNMEISFERLLILFLFLVIGAAFGSKILFIITRIPHILSEFSLGHLLNEIITGGFVFYGGLLGAIGGAVLYAKYFRYEVVIITNLITPAFPLFHFWGRIGCLFAGCCYGKVADWGLPLANEPDVLRIPIQLFEAVILLLIVVAVLWCEKHRQNINLMQIYLTLYAVCRLGIEFFRGDEIRGIWWGLSTSQWISLVIVIWSVVALIKNKCNMKGETNEKV